MPRTDYQTPGQMVRVLLQEKGWTHRVLATVLNTHEQAISLLVNDKRAIKPELALQLSAVFGVPAETFVEVQARYDLAHARMEFPPADPAMARRADLFGRLPVAEMIARGWIRASDVRDPNVEPELARFFGVQSPDEIEVLPHAAKKTGTFGPATPAQIAWLHRVRRIAEEILVPRYSPHSLESALPKLRQLMGAPDSIRDVPRVLMECGIRYAIVETIGDAKVDGVCFWLKDGMAPVVAMSCRFDRIDNFWFVLRHELEHVLREHGRNAVMLDSDFHVEGPAAASTSISEEERLANEAAAEFCVPREKLRKFVTLKAPFFPERDMLGFARTLRVHPGIVAGQIRNATRRYELFGKHLVKVRTFATSAATVDGWGDVVPLSS